MNAAIFRFLFYFST
ncbi:pheST operon leader peptide PheM [Salmonella enterica]|nr:pheST operon leader peptide PheM [Salmonella enterica]EGU5100953.1 pheST operon leader peptide PheM [Salmonella enterica]MCS5961475.1 pheST operon leader peptide PheM [Klebsiella pneumoniae subsp. pneumoniae]UMX81008.1 pheST operon leader peptide PheM [Klebsiella pneumoniae]